MNSSNIDPNQQHLSLTPAQNNDRLESERLLQEGIAAFERLAEDPVAWAEYQAESKLFEATLMDGLRETIDCEDIVY